MRFKHTLARFATWYSGLMPLQQAFVWGLYGALCWGGFMTAFVFCFAWLTNETLRNPFLVLFICLSVGFAWGVAMWRSAKRRRSQSSGGGA